MHLPPEAPLLPGRLLAAARVVANREAMLALLPRGGVFVEVGVGLGDFSALAMDVCAPRLFIAIDDFRLHERAEFWGRETAGLWAGSTHGAVYRARFAAAIADGRMRVIEADSAAGLGQLPDGVADVIYVDADHRYAYVVRDLAAARTKLRPDGWIVANDYLMVAEVGALEPYGVVQATNEFMIRHDFGMVYFALQTRMFCDVALRPAASVVPAEDGLRAEIAALRGSRSWRLTAGLRGLARLVRGPSRRDSGSAPRRRR